MSWRPLFLGGKGPVHRFTKITPDPSAGTQSRGAESLGTPKVDATGFGAKPDPAKCVQETNRWAKREN